MTYQLLRDKKSHADTTSPWPCFVASDSEWQGATADRQPDSGTSAV